MKAYLLLIFILIIASDFINAQVSRSNEILISNENKYYKHFVEEGENIDVICSLYNVSLMKLG